MTPGRDISATSTKDPIPAKGNEKYDQDLEGKLFRISFSKMRIKYVIHVNSAS